MFDIWQHDDQKEFVKEIRSVDPNVTGTPVQLLRIHQTAQGQLHSGGVLRAGGDCGHGVHPFSQPGFIVLLALLPVAIGTIWMGGLMGCFGIPFNPANIMTLPLVIGIGVTNGIHILNRYAEEGIAGILSKSTGKAVFVSGLTAIAGFGSLMLAQASGNSQPW